MSRVPPHVSDEALEGCGLSREYTISAYVEFAKRLADKASSLGGSWTAECVGRALWSAAMHSAHGIKSTNGSGSGSVIESGAAVAKKGVKRKAEGGQSRDQTPSKEAASTEPTPSKRGRRTAAAQ